MFIQLIEGRVNDRDRLRQQLERWQEELRPNAEGFLGSTAGITPDGTGFLAARFASPEAAQRNADRPEQGAWWADTEACFEGDVSFTDCTDVETLLGGGSDDAGFVQVIRGRLSDVQRARALLGGFEAELQEARPDVLGGYVALHGGDAYTQVVYFSSEEEARQGERGDPPEEYAKLDREFMDLHVEEPRFLDLPDPWMVSP